MSWQERIVRDPKVFSGKPTVKGTRVSVDLVMTQLGWGMTDGEIVEYHYPYLTAEAVAACREYVTDGQPMGCITDPKIDALLAAGNADDCPGSKEPGMGWVGRIVSTPEVVFGKPRIKGTRIYVGLVVQDLNAGYTPEQIIEGWPHITVEDIAACREFAATGHPLYNSTEEESDALWDAHEFAERLRLNRNGDEHSG